MTKYMSETLANEKCNNWQNSQISQKGLENNEIILKIIEDKIKIKDLDSNEWRNSDKDSEDGNVMCCSVCKKKCSPESQKMCVNNENYKPIDTSSNNYGTINPVVVINVFKDENQEQIKMCGIINEAFLNEEETRFDLRVIPEIDAKECDGSLKVDNLAKHESNFQNSDKRRNSSKRSMTSNISHNSLQKSMSSRRSMTSRRSTSSAITTNSSEKRRESIRNMLFGDPELSLRRFSQDIRNEDKKEFVDEYETYKVVFLQVFLPFLIAGFGNVGAGLILDRVQHWEVFQKVTELFILVASFLGFKGNLEMTLAARLSTQANLGNLDKPSQQWKMGVGNIILIQCQAIVVALLASMIAILVNILKEWRFQAEHCLLICATSLITASITGLFLATLMIVVIIIARKTGVNPDNCSTLIAAFLGDISAVVMLSLSARLMFMIKDMFWVAPTLIAMFLVILPFFIYIAKNNEYTSEVIHKGWYPIIIAMLISSIGGFIFDFAVTIFETIAIFQPIINGVGANLVAVQASRISTYLHQRCSLGEKPPNSCKVNTNICQLPQNVFVGSNTNVRTARLLLLMAIPGHLIYIITIRLIKLEEVVLTIPFVAIYLLVALIQVSILLYIAHVLVPFLWTKKIDPDNSAIPGIMATGDLIGTTLLTLAYIILVTIGDPNALNKQLEDYKL